MPTLGNALDFAKYEARNIRGHQLGTAPSSPVTGQLYYNTADNTLYWWDGSAWVSGRGAGPATTSSLGTIQLAGDLAGTATSPQIAAGVITDADVNSANKDGAVGTASMRTLGAGAQQAMPGNRTLNAISPPVADVSMQGYKLAWIGSPTNADDAANKQYVDDTTQGLDAKQSVRVATTANITDLTNVTVIDGVTLADGDRVLVKNQTTASQNGIYTALLSPPMGLYTRATDASIWNELVSAFVWVEEGTANKDTAWVCTADRGGTLGTTNVPWSQFASAAGGLPSAPSGPAGGDLSGTYPNPQIAAGVVTDVDVAAANKDGLSNVPSMRTLGWTAGQAMASTVSLSAIASQNLNGGDTTFNSRKITNLADPTVGTDGANKQYVDTFASGLDAKASVKCATTANISLTGTGPTIDGVTASVGSRVLVKDQTTPAQNGIYVVPAAGAWSRATDMDAWTEVPSAFVWVEQGTANGDTGWVCTADQGGTLDTTAITWAQFSGAAQITAGAGLTKTGNTLDVGQGSGITVAADTISVDSAVIPRYYSSATHGAGTTWTITQATHLCRASRGLIIQCQVEATGAVVLPDIGVAANGDVTITFGTSQTANTIRTTVIG